MANLIKEVKQINHKLTVDELAELSQKNAMLNIEIEEKKLEGKNITAQYANKVKTLEAKRSEISQKVLSKCELREVFCYARKNFVTSTIEYISMEGEIIMEEQFRPSDYRKQFELKEELAQKKLEKIKYFGMKYFYDEFGKFEGVNIDSTEEEVTEALNNEKNRTRFISKCITWLVEDKKILEIDDDIEFDAVYEIAEGWYNEYCTKYFVEPTESDYPIPEEKEDVEQVPETIENKVEKKSKSAKGKKQEDQNEEPSQNEDLKDDIDNVFS